jgi:hypothetical protein
MANNANVCNDVEHVRYRYENDFHKDCKVQYQLHHHQFVIVVHFRVNISQRYYIDMHLVSKIDKKRIYLIKTDLMTC